MCIVFTTNYFLIESDISDNSETLLVTEFINLKIKSAQFFRGVYKGRVCV
jgi:hypothetical protein